MFPNVSSCLSRLSMSLHVFSSLFMSHVPLVREDRGRGGGGGEYACRGDNALMVGGGGRGGENGRDGEDAWWGE